MINYEKIEIFLKSILTAQDEYKLADYLKVWDVGSREREEVTMSIFESKLLYPLSQVVEYIRQGRQIDYYIDHIALIKAPKIVTREEIFYALSRFQKDNKEAVRKVLYAIYEGGDEWNTLESAITRDDLKTFEQSMGSDERAVNLKKIVCHYLTIVDNTPLLYRGYESPCLVECDVAEPTSSSLEEQRSVAKEILSLCVDLMLSGKEESYIKQICSDSIIKRNCFFQGWSSYSEVRKQKQTTIKAQPKSNLTTFEKMLNPSLSEAEKEVLMVRLTKFFTSGVKGKQVALHLNALIRLNYLDSSAKRKVIYNAIKEHFGCDIGADSSINKQWNKDEHNELIEEIKQRYIVKSSLK